METLREGEYTLFAPGDTVFAKEPLLGQAALRDLLENHMLKGRLLSTKLQEGKRVKTAYGDQVTISRQGELMLLTDATGRTVHVTHANLSLNNGVIHAVDGFLQPSGDRAARGGR